MLINNKKLRFLFVDFQVTVKSAKKIKCSTSKLSMLHRLGRIGFLDLRVVLNAL